MGKVGLKVFNLILCCYFYTKLLLFCTELQTLLPRYSVEYICCCDFLKLAMEQCSQRCVDDLHSVIPKVEHLNILETITSDSAGQ